MAFYTLLVVFPFIIFLYLLLFKKLSLLTCSVVTFILFLLLSVFVWQITPANLYLSLTKGLMTALDILYIIVGALFFLAILRHFHIIDHLIVYLESLSPDYRIQIILLAWLLECFLEGIAGFGTPSTIVAPILVNLGLSPMVSVVLSLLGNSTSVAFGAAGTPIRTGFASLDQTGIAPMTAALNWVGLVIPVFMAWVIVRHRRRPLSDFFEIIPFSLWSGFVFVFSSYLIVSYSQELTSILGSILAFIIIFISIKLKLFTPRINIPFPHEKLHSVRSTTLIKTVFPYLTLIIILIISKNYLNPGFAFIITGLIFTFLWRLSLPDLFLFFKKSLKSALEPFLIILLMSSIVQIITKTTMINYLVDLIKNFGIPVMAPFIGTFGSFITGSATISNIMFGSILSKASIDQNLNPIIILSLQLAGASVGNMIALSDMITAEIVVGLKNHESQLIRQLLPFCLILIVMLAIIGYVITAS